MEKYDRISKITQDYLDGKLGKLHLNYNDNHSLDLVIEYQDSHEIWFDYEMILDLKTGKVCTASHQSEGYLNKVTLDRQIQFEDAVQKYLICH